MADETIYFISDAHMGAEPQEREQIKLEKLLSFLAWVKTQKARLIICGDLFDFWFEYKTAIPKQHFDVLCALRDLARTGHHIDYLAGNHDFWLDTFLSQNIGLVIHPDHLVLQRDGERIFLVHGDGLMKKDVLYRLLKRILRNPMNIYLYRLLHPDIGIWLAHFFSRLSRKASANREYYTDEDYRGFACEMIEKGYEMVVLGHTHWPAVEAVENGWYLNPGAWMETFTFLRLDAGRPELFIWDGNAPQPARFGYPPGHSGYRADKK